MAKAVRMSDIAEQLQISTVTVSKALAGKDGVSEELRKKIQKLAVEMGYQFQKNKQEQTPCYTIGIITSYRYIEKGQSFYWAMYERVLFHNFKFFLCKLAGFIQNFSSIPILPIS